MKHLPQVQTLNILKFYHIDEKSAPAVSACSLCKNMHRHKMLDSINSMKSHAKTCTCTRLVTCAMGLEYQWFILNESEDSFCSNAKAVFVTLCKKCFIQLLQVSDQIEYCNIDHENQYLYILHRQDI